MDKIKLIDAEFDKMANILQAENTDLAMVKKTKEDFAHFVTHTLQNSMLTGIPQIAQARNCSKRLIRTLVFCFCIAGFIYQSYSFMSIYWEYDVVMDVQVINPFFTEPPAVTVCHKKGIKQDELCRDPSPSTQAMLKNFSLSCESVEYVVDLIEELNCDCHPRLCHSNGTVKDWLWLSPPRNSYIIPYEDIKPWLFTPREIGYPCTLHNAQTRGGELPPRCHIPGYVKQIPCGSFGAREACATYYSLYGEPNKTWPEISIGTEILLQTTFYDKYVEENDREDEVYVSVHDPRTVVNPFREGIKVHPMRSYDFRVNKVEKRLLPAPYKTNCMDYKSAWKSRGGQGPLSLKECLMECQVNVSLQLYGCVMSGLYFIGFAPRCFIQGDDDARLQRVYKEANELSPKVCGAACEETYYTINVRDKNDNQVHCITGPSKLAGIHVTLDGMEITRYSYTPKYQDIETFSYVGGYVGMWLGISLVAVFDFLETVFMMMKYPLRRFKRFRSKRKIQNQIIHGHLHH